MKTLLFLILVSSPSWAAVKNVKLDSIGYGALLHLNGEIQLPQGQKLNKGAPSNVTVYERENKSQKDWVVTQKMSLNDFFSMTELIHFQHPFKLRSEKSEIRVTANVYHCEKVKSNMCVIDDFEGFISRSKSKVTSEVTMKLVGTDPKKLYGASKTN